MTKHSHGFGLVPLEQDQQSMLPKFTHIIKAPLSLVTERYDDHDPYFLPTSSPALLEQKVVETL